MRNVSSKSCRKNQNTLFIFSIFRAGYCLLYAAFHPSQNNAARGNERVKCIFTLACDEGAVPGPQYSRYAVCLSQWVQAICQRVVIQCTYLNSNPLYYTPIVRVVRILMCNSDALAQDRSNWRDFVNTVMNIRAAYNVEHFSSSCGLTGFPRRTLLRRVPSELTWIFTPRPRKLHIFSQEVTENCKMNSKPAFMLFCMSVNVLTVFYFMFVKTFYVRTSCVCIRSCMM